MRTQNQIGQIYASPHAAWAGTAWGGQHAELSQVGEDLQHPFPRLAQRGLQRWHSPAGHVAGSAGAAGGVPKGGCHRRAARHVLRTEK